MAYIDRVTRPAEFAFNYTLPVSLMEEASIPKKSTSSGYSMSFEIVPLRLCVR